jgi:hypothetical protein
VAAIRFGDIATAQAFVAEPAIRRVLDTRVAGGKLHAGEERVITLGIPPNARSAVINLTLTNTDQAGYVAVFRANTVWPGTRASTGSPPARASPSSDLARSTAADQSASAAATPPTSLSRRKGAVFEARATCAAIGSWRAGRLHVNPRLASRPSADGRPR